MKKFLVLALLLGQLFGLEATKQNVLKLKYDHIPIIDIRLPSEWQATGTIPGALRITFFTRSGAINQSFLQQLHNHKIKLNSKFALICRTGHRSKIATQILQNSGYKNVIDLEGGMFNLFKSLLKELK